LQLHAIRWKTSRRRWALWLMSAGKVN